MRKKPVPAGVAACDKLARVLNEWIELAHNEKARHDEHAATRRVRLAAFLGVTEDELICEVEEERRGTRARRPQSAAERELIDALATEMREIEQELLARRTEMAATAASLAFDVIVFAQRWAPRVGRAAIRGIAAGFTEPRKSIYDTEPRPPRNLRGALGELKLIREKMPPRPPRPRTQPAR